MRRLFSLLLFPVLAGVPLLGGCAREGPAATEPASAGPASEEVLAFTDMTAAAGLDAFRHVNGAFGEKWFPETMGAGGGFIDYDGDGWADVLLVGGGGWPQSPGRDVPALRLFRNLGDDGSGTGPAPGFADVTADAGLDGLRTYGFGVTVADYDNDGDPDIYLTTLEENLLLRNDGGVFADVAPEAGVAGPSVWSSAAVFFDADADGALDLFVGNYVVWSPANDLWCSADGENKGYCTPELYEGAPGFFYRNRGDGTFEDATAAAGFAAVKGKTLGAATLDFNADGWLDLVVTNDTDPDLLFQNNGDGTFDEIGVLSGIAFDERGRARAGMGVDAGVVDDTGQETIFVGNFSNEMISVFRHVGGGVFIDRSAPSRIGRSSLLTLTFGLFLFDVDLDGDLDLFAANGHVQPDIERVKDNVGFDEPPHLFLNRGDGTFDDVAPVLGGVMADSLVGRGAAFADVDRDGDLDVLLTENNGPAHLWRNDLAGAPHYLRVAVEGRRSNRDGVGARIVAVVGARRLERRVRTGSSFLSSSEKVATFGLGGKTRVDSLLVYWPGGQVDRFADVEGDRAILVVEGEGMQDGLATHGRR